MKYCRTCGNIFITPFKQAKKCFNCYSKRKSTQTIKKNRMKQYKYLLEENDKKNTRKN